MKSLFAWLAPRPPAPAALPPGVTLRPDGTVENQSDGRWRPREVNLAFEALDAARHTGVMVDVGAHGGESFSRFAKHHWRIHAFEPDSANRAKLREKFGALPNLTLDPRAVSDEPAAAATLFTSSVATSISSLAAFHESHSAGEKVAVTSLDLFFAEAGLTAVDFLKIDAEGFDWRVLRGVPWARVRPRFVMCEFEDIRTSDADGYRMDNMGRLLHEQGYTVIVSEWFPVRQYGVLHDWRRFARFPCGLADPKGWGNLLAAREPAVVQTLLRVCGLEPDPHAARGPRKGVWLEKPGKGK
jgi:FkbM family methyltransferase